MTPNDYASSHPPIGPRATNGAEDRYLPARQVWQRYGVTSMTLHRWIADERMNFPEPVYFGRLRFWRASELEAWERAQPRGKAA